MGVFLFDKTNHLVYYDSMKTLKDILSYYGYINSDQLAELNEHFPLTRD